MNATGIAVSCRCGQRFSAEPRLAGRQLPCPACGQPLVIGPAPQLTAHVSKPGSIPVACVCGQRFAAAPHLSGRQVSCPKCGNQLVIPASPSGIPAGARSAPTPATQHAPLSTPQPIDPIGNMAMPQSGYSPTTHSATSITYPSKKKQAPSSFANRWVVGGVAIGASALVLLMIGFVAAGPVMKALGLGKSPEQVATTAPESIAAEPAGFAPPQANSAPILTPTTPTPSSVAATPPPKPVPNLPTVIGSPQTGPAPATSSHIGTPVTNLADVRGSRPAADLSTAATSASGTRRMTAPLAKGLLQWASDDDRKRAGLRRVGPGDHPIEHYSWMCELLPLLGQQEVYDKLNFNQSWKEGANVASAQRVIPEFLNPGDNRDRWQGYPFNGFGLTHFVGMSGIEDKRNIVAATLPRSDPRAGIFGYDHVATAQEITDGTSNTIMVIGSGDIASPWIQGGGATVRGAREPYFGKITGFGSRGTKQGAVVMMADGSVRHVPANIDPKVFRALCTIHGSESVDLVHAPEFEMPPLAGR